MGNALHKFRMMFESSNVSGHFPKTDTWAGGHFDVSEAQLKRDALSASVTPAPECVCVCTGLFPLMSSLEIL